jgi:hypothetical protein
MDASVRVYIWEKWEKKGTVAGSLWCRRRDLNPHGLPHTPLKRACLPGSTTSAQTSMLQQ